MYIYIHMWAAPGGRGRGISQRGEARPRRRCAAAAAPALVNLMVKMVVKCMVKLTCGES